MQGEIDSETLKFEVNINKITSSLKEDSAARNAKLLSSLQSDVENTLKVLSGNLEKSLSNTRETLKKDLEFSQEKIGKAKADAEKLQASLTKAKSTADSLVKVFIFIEVICDRSLKKGAMKLFPKQLQHFLNNKLVSVL